MATADPFADVDFRPVALPRLPLRQASRYAIGLTRALRQAPPDLIEVHNRPDIALHLARRFPAIPVVLFVHNDPQGMRRAKTPAERQHLLARLALVAPVSRYLAGRLVEGIDRPPAITVFPNCIDLAGIPQTARQKLILFAGRVVADKGADSFVAACALALPQLPGWRAELIGADRFGADSPDTPFLRALRPRAHAAGVTMSGWRPHDQVLAAMASAEIVVVPSRWPEPFGLTALEAMACGAALLCSPRGGLAEVIGDAAVAIDPDDPAAIAAVLVRLAGDDAARAALADAGRTRAQQFGLPEAAARLARLRGSVLAAWPNAPSRPI
jgi:glycosyltransferase involved in cell wall biosynthesis